MESNTPHRVDPALNIPLGQRYTAAWAEINSRISSRQTVSIFLSTVSLGLVTPILGYLFQTGKPSPLLEFLSSGLIVLVWSFAFWIRHNDAIIGLLSSYCKALELLDDPDNTKGLPAWHSDSQKWIIEARRFRKYSDRAFILIALIDCLPVLSLAIYRFTQNQWFPGFLLVSVFVLGLLAVRFVYVGGKLRDKIAKHSFFSQDGKWTFGELNELHKRISS